jgi:hypothetical protein
LEQATAAAAVASGDPLVVVEGAAGAGKTTMLGVSIEAARADGRATRIVTPTMKAADVAAREFGVPTDSVAKLAHDNGWRWNQDGVWTRLAIGTVDPDNGNTYTVLALLQIADQARASLALVGDRAQLPAVGRGGLLDIAAQVSQRTFDLARVHRSGRRAAARTAREANEAHDTSQDAMRRRWGAVPQTPTLGSSRRGRTPHAPTNSWGTSPGTTRMHRRRSGGASASGPAAPSAASGRARRWPARGARVGQ